ncbi:MAG TPA: glycosyltransferase [Chromatiales bacterium]|nr:glycosyltransferase [Chromatiales bacterium]
MGRPDFSIVVLTHRRDDVLQRQFEVLAAATAGRASELILVDNNPDDRDRAPPARLGLACRVVKPGCNLGVAAGRNRGAAVARGRWLVFVDDDALFASPDPLGVVEATFRQHEGTGILAFRSLVGDSGRIDRSEFPHTDKRRDPLVPFDTFRFIGVGFAVRAEVFDTVGGFCEDFFYGMEEFDFAYRAIRAGFRIRYEPRIVVRHYRHRAGRIAPGERYYRYWLNKMKVNYRNLPARYVWGAALPWSAYVLVRAGPLVLGRAVRDFLRWRRAAAEQRQVLDGRALAYLRQVGANLYR